MSGNIITENNTEKPSFEFDLSGYEPKKDATLPERNYENSDRNFPNRRRIKVVTQTPEEMIADIESLPLQEGETKGTAVTKELLEKFHDVIEQADANALSAYNMVDLVADEMTKYLDETNKYVTKIKQELQGDFGTQVFVGENPVGEFYADTKADQTALNSLDVRVQTLENEKVITNIIYDSSTDTFMF